MTMLKLPWTTEADLPYGEQPRIYDATGALVAVVGNAEIDKQDDWERNATAIVSAVNATGNPGVAENATCKPALQVAAPLSTITPAEAGGLVERLRGIPPKWVDLRLGEEAASLIQSQAARIAELEAERAALRLAADRADRTETQLAEARKALEPFADVASEWDGEPGSLHVFLEWNDDGNPVPSLPVADFRAARRALEAQGGENGE